MHDSSQLSETFDNSSTQGSQLPPAAPLLPPDWNYEMTVAQIESIINRIELGELELADVFNQFATAAGQLRQCEAFLVRQRHQVDLLIETLLDEPEGF
ncbi:MAG: exodeoxyribonuclease VII small subunit [Leptolyngbyaceae cyanobacterium CRU_2_3]|nr:exodeoxyribonuclease VII small subunit [Leptolyngbyaceae cyanobacterium CRU_2_3]